MFVDQHLLGVAAKCRQYGCAKSSISVDTVDDDLSAGGNGNVFPRNGDDLHLDLCLQRVRLLVYLEKNLRGCELTRANAVIVNGAHRLLMQDEHVGDAVDGQEGIS